MGALPSDLLPGEGGQEHDGAEPEITEYKDYENGVADVLSFLAGDAATVEQDVKLPTRGGRTRQVDVLVRGSVFGFVDATVVVDCKRWARRIDVADVGAFIDLVNDVRADVGLLISTEGPTSGAVDRRHEVRGVRLEVMTLEELKAWRPPGTVTTSYRIPAAGQAAAERALRKAGFRVVPGPASETAPGERVLEVFSHYGTPNPDGELQRTQWDRAETALRDLGLEPVHVSHGITIAGGTPAHRWLEVAIDGVGSGVKVLADSETEAEAQLDGVANTLARLGITRGALSVIPPDGWPVPPFFGGPGPA